jgi:hypothetical protein
VLYLGRSAEEGLKTPHAREDAKVWGSGAAGHEYCSKELGPEENWKATEPRYEDDSNYTAPSYVTLFSFVREWIGRLLTEEEEGPFGQLRSAIGQ